MKSSKWLIMCSFYHRRRVRNARRVRYPFKATRTVRHLVRRCAWRRGTNTMPFKNLLCRTVRIGPRFRFLVSMGLIAASIQWFRYRRRAVVAIMMLLRLWLSMSLISRSLRYKNWTVIFLLLKKKSYRSIWWKHQPFRKECYPVNSELLPLPSTSMYLLRQFQPCWCKSNLASHKRKTTKRKN